MTDAHDIARGHWLDLLPRLGVDPKYLVNKHGPCPICHGKDRFRFDNQYEQGGWICNQCGAGDGYALAARSTGQTFKTVFDKVRDMLGVDRGQIMPSWTVDELHQRQKMKAVWEGSGAPSLGGPIDTYLTTRVGCLWPSQAIREGIWGDMPVMVCKIDDHAGSRAVNLHLTFLTLDGRKASINPAKRVMRGSLPDGCAIRLGPTKARMGVAEGIETAISAAILFDMPVWACINGNLLSKWIPPAQAEQITVFGDNDANYCGQAKAYHLANRLEVQFKRRVKVEIPVQTGDDWNDSLHYRCPYTPKDITHFLRVVK